MYHECRHIMPSGKKCHSPALHNQAYCYYHNNLRRYSRPPVGDNLSLSSIEDNRGIQIALTQVLTALNSPYMDTRRAGLLLYGLQIATQLANRTSGLEPDEAVRTCDDSTGAALAPGKTVCEPPRDCRNCTRQDTCENYEEEEVEEAEEPRCDEHTTGDDANSEDHKPKEGADDSDDEEEDDDLEDEEAPDECNEHSSDEGDEDEDEADEKEATLIRSARAILAT
ncbi:MAG: hypothetical protein WB561_05545 [Terracidiphilus sp.]